VDPGKQIGAVIDDHARSPLDHRAHMCGKLVGALSSRAMNLCAIVLA
jgi:hypothetical protein